MTKENIKRIHLIFRIALSAVIVIAGICLMAACVSIYRSGEQPFSREAVANAFSYIAVPVYLCLVMVLLGFILELILPPDVPRKPAEKQYGLILKRLHDKTDLNECDESLRSAVLAQQRNRRLHKIISIVLMFVGSIIFLIYAWNGSNFHPSEINSSMIQAMCILLPCVAVPFAYGIFSAFYSKTSMQREIELLKQAKASTKQPIQKPAPKISSKPISVLRCAIVAAGIALLLYGFFNDGTADVLTKAINICTECVGLG